MNLTHENRRVKLLSANRIVRITGNWLYVSFRLRLNCLNCERASKLRWYYIYNRIKEENQKLFYRHKVGYL